MDVSVTRVEQTCRAEGDDALWRMISEAGVRMSGLLRAQTPERRAAARAAMIEGVRALPDPAALPMPALVGAGAKPG